MADVLRYPSSSSKLMIPFPGPRSPRRAEAVCEFQGYVDDDTVQSLAGWGGNSSKCLGVSASVQHFHTIGGFRGFNWNVGIEKAKQTVWEWNASKAVATALLRGGGLDTEGDGICKHIDTTENVEEGEKKVEKEEEENDDEDWVVITTDPEPVVDGQGNCIIS